MKYLIKFYDADWSYIWTIAPDKLKNRIEFDAQINGWYWELKLVFDTDFNLNLWQIFTVKLYAITDFYREWKVIYQWLLDQQIWIKKTFEEITFRFVWFWTILYDKLYYRYATSDLEYNFLQADWPEGFIYKFIDIVNTQKTTFTSISWTFTDGETIEGLNVWELENLYSNIAYVRPYDLPFVDWETITWQSSWATATITILYENIYLNKLSAWTIETYWTTFWYNTDYENMGRIFERIIEFSNNFYYFINSSWVITYENLDNVKKHISIFWKDLYEIEEIKRYNDIINRVFIRYYDSAGNEQTISEEDIDSIWKYWLKEKLIVRWDVDDYTTAHQMADRIIKNNKEPVREIRIKANVKYQNIETKTTWEDITTAWSSQTNTWQDITTTIDWIFDIMPWNKVNIRNIDDDLAYSDLVVQKIKYRDDHMIILLNDYKNYTNLIIN